MSRPESRPPRPWYGEGLRFECQEGCAQCCGGDPGVVWVKPEEAEAIAKHLGITLEDFYESYTRSVGRRTSLTEMPNGNCVMLSKARCKIYQVRPVQCRTYPFWPWNLESPSDWAALCQECPGVNMGKLHTYEEIEEQRRKRL